MKFLCAQRVYGVAGGSVALPAVTAALLDTDGSESLVLTLAGLPEGSVLVDGTRSVTVGAAGQALDLTGWSLGTLALQAPAGFVGSFQVQLRAVASDGGGSSTAMTLREVEVVVLEGPAAETPAGVNPFVTLATAQRKTAQAAIGSEATPPAPVRTAADEAEEEQKRQRRVGDAWLEDLERSARTQWQALMGAAEVLQ